MLLLQPQKAQLDDVCGNDCLSKSSLMIVDGNFFLQADEEDQEMVVEGDDAEVPAPGADPEEPCPECGQFFASLSNLQVFAIWHAF